MQFSFFLIYLHDMFDNYQWRVTLYLALFTALITRVSPSRTSNVGPGKSPFTVIVLWILHSLFTGLAWICFHPREKGKKGIYFTALYSITSKRQEDSNEENTYNKLSVVSFCSREMSLETEDYKNAKKKAVGNLLDRQVTSLHCCVSSL